METRVLTHKANLLIAKLSVNILHNQHAQEMSPQFKFSDAALFQVLLTSSRVGAEIDKSFVYVRFAKQRDDHDLTYVMYLDSVELNIVAKTFTSDDGTWHLICDKYERRFTFDVRVEMRLHPSASLFVALHGDTELTDLELRGEDGSVRMHRAVLAAASPVLRRMLTGEWRETVEGNVDVTGTSKATLEHFKSYVYLHKLPKSGLEQLLLLSSYYIMPELERACMDKLVRGVSAENVWDLIEFATKNKMKRLMLAVLEGTHYGTISVMKIRDHLDESEDAPKTAK